MTQAKIGNGSQKSNEHEEKTSQKQESDKTVTEKINSLPENSDTGDKNGLKMVQKYPKGVYFVYGGEFTQSFSYYGMEALLTLYFINSHGMTNSRATLIFHTFHFVAYFSPLFGSIAADGYLGKYKVIVYVSTVYTIGHILLTVGAIESLQYGTRVALDLTALLIIGIATGAVEACGVAFGADQFPSTMLKEREEFFSSFYCCSNCGGFSAVILTPIFHTQVNYTLAFGVCAVFLFVSLVIYVSGRPFYKIVECKENVVWNVIKCTCSAIKQTVKNRGAPPNDGHWLDYSAPIYGIRMVDDIKTIFSVVLLFIPAIMFFALLDQQASTWVLQGSRMDGRLGRLIILPEQMNVLNLLFTMALIPVSVKIVYPALTARDILVKPLKRMVCGGILATISFLIAGLIQLKINTTMVSVPDAGYVKYTLVNFAECDISLDDFRMNVDDVVTKDILKPNNNRALPYFQFEKECSSSYNFTQSNYVFKESCGELVVFWNSAISQISYDLEKTEESHAKLYPVFDPYYANYQNVTLLVKHGEKSSHVIRYNYLDAGSIIVKPDSIWDNHKFELFLEICNENFVNCTEIRLLKYETKPGEAYALVIRDNGTYLMYNLIPPNTVHILWQIPQYFVITVGEILFSISGQEFSYSQAAESMKSVLNSVWLMTVAFGNVVNMIITGSGMIENKAVEFFVYALLMILVLIVFEILARRYKYKNRDHERHEHENYDPIKKP